MASCKLDDILRWYASSDGRLAESSLFAVWDALENATADPQKKQVIWHDGARLSIDQTVDRIHSDSGLPLDRIEPHVITWLEMEYQPTGLNEQQKEEFEQLIDNWLQPYL